MADCVLQVRVTPKSSRNRVVIESDLVKVYVTSPPADGEANQAVVETVAKSLKIAKSRVELVKGHTSREKTLAIQGLGLDEVLALLS